MKKSNGTLKDNRFSTVFASKERFLDLMVKGLILTLTRPIGSPPQAPVAQKLRISADLSLNRQKMGTLLYKMMIIKVSKCG